MTMQSPARSLLERAAEVFDFDGLIGATPDYSQPEPGRAESRVPSPSHSAAPSGPLPLPRGERGECAPLDRVALEAAGFIMPDAPVNALAEEFRIVKRQLLHRAVAGDAEQRDRMILVASAQPGEGKTFCAVNLALSIANERDFEVLLVDADVAKPSILSTLGLPGGPGLIDALEGTVDPEDCIIATDLPGLSVLPAGRRANEATEILASERTRDLLDRLAGADPRRIIIFDSPPALAASPASELAHHVGQVMLVVRADRTSEFDLRDTVSLLAGCDDIRLLLNGVQFAGGGRRFGYYGYGD